MTSRDFFDDGFRALTGHAPMSWQQRLFEEYLVPANLPSALDIPTGLGKTSVMTIWYLARKAGAQLPRRLVYVVDRRAVVDQATEVADRLKKHDDTLRVSTLRGKHVDNRKWLEDPTAPAIIVGTVDMIGSRLLFSGYGVSAKMRPYHAGLLGADTLVVLDEAHLVPPFEALLETVETGQKIFGPSDEEKTKIIPPFRLLSLSATGRDRAGRMFRLDQGDFNDAVITERLKAEKRLTLHEFKEAKALVGELATRAWKLATEGPPARVLVFCESREDALKVKDEIDKRVGKEKIESELLVGERRVHEREKLSGWLKANGFVNAAGKAPEVPTFLVATSAGEVGVDLDADHMVCDLVEWERMVQRFGRVNRRGGKGRAAIIEVIAAPPKKERDGEKCPDRLTRLRKPLDALKGNASPGAIVALKQDRALKDALEAAETPAPLRPALTRPLVDAWSMTSLDEHTGRPEIQPWLRGWKKDEEAQTTILWRKHLPARIDGVRSTKKEVNDFFDAAPPQTSETLEAATWHLGDWLFDRVKAKIKSQDKSKAQAASDPPEHKIATLFVLKSNEDLDDSQQAQWTLGELAKLDTKGRERDKKNFVEALAGRILVVSSSLDGLNGDGMLDREWDVEAVAIDNTAVWQPQPSFQVRETTDGEPSKTDNWRETFRLPIERDDDGGETRWIVVEQHRSDAESEEGRAVAPSCQKLQDHKSAVERIARSFAEVLGLPQEYCGVLALAARLHDEGKRAVRWQRAFRAPFGDVYAKTKGPIDRNLLDGYRHEFGSLFCIEKDDEFCRLSSDLQDLVLHLVAAHHGSARPLISTKSCEQAPPSVLTDRAREVALRFARLQKRWGPWGLAWWEALLRAADQRASRENDARPDEKSEKRSVEEMA